MNKADRIAKKIEKVNNMEFAHEYQRKAMMWRATHDMGLKFDEVITLQNARENIGLYYTLEHRGKMLGLNSLSTYCGCNPRCKRNHCIEGSICEACFAFTQTDMYASMIPSLTENYNILTTELIEWNDIPIYNVLKSRFESFGDVANITQAENYLRFIMANRDTFFGWWSKNMDIIDEMFKATGYKKPDNVNFIQSSLFVNKETKPRFWFVDKVFTVYDGPTVPINCGARNCLRCGLCYGKNDTVYVNELKK